MLVGRYGRPTGQRAGGTRYRRAAEIGHDSSQYVLGKLLQSQKRADEATSQYDIAAAQGNQYAAYRLGKLYLIGEDMKQHRDQVYGWFRKSASQGNEYVHFFLDHSDEIRRPNVLLATTKLLRHTGWLFQGNSVSPCPPGSQRAGRKPLQKIRQKKITLGHKLDDHEDEQSSGVMTMGGI